MSCEQIQSKYSDINSNNKLYKYIKNINLNQYRNKADMMAESKEARKSEIDKKGKKVIKYEICVYSTVAYPVMEIWL